MHITWPGVFQFSTLLSVDLCDSKYISISGTSSSSCNFFVIHPFGRSAISFLFSHLLQNFFVSFVSGCSFVFVHRLVGRIFFHYFWKVLFCLYYLILSSYFLVWLFISTSYIVSLVCCSFFRSFHSIESLCIFPS